MRATRDVPPRRVAIPVAQAVGRISCESIAAYPPGVPSLLHGASDPRFETVIVVDEG